MNTAYIINTANYFSWIKYVITLLLLTITFNTAQAHEIRPAIVDLKLEENQQYEVTIRLNLEALIAQIGPAHNDTEESKNASTYNELRKLSAEQLKPRFDEFLPELLQGITLLADSKRQSPQVAQLKIPDVGDTDLSRDSTIILSGKLPVNTKLINWSWDENFGANALRVSTPTVKDLYSEYLQKGKKSADIPVTATKKVEQSSFDIFKNYLVIGFEHILPKGLDHILFVIGLFLLSIKMRPLLLQITSFTLAHSVTLALGMMGVLQVSSSIVEPLIAASIVYVCLENIYSDKLNAWRPFVIFAFGLLHGLGFSSVLMEIGLAKEHFVTGLVAFNIGVEIGQVTVIALCFLAVGLWFRHKPWYRKCITIPASAVIAAIGTYWLIERTILS